MGKYVEQLENLYVLMETKLMLEENLLQLENNEEKSKQIKADIEKIKQDIAEITNGVIIEDHFNMNALFNPALTNDQSDT